MRSRNGGASGAQDVPRTLREDRTESRRVGHERCSVCSRYEDYGPEAIAADTIELSGLLQAKRSWRLPHSIGCL
jgi:predicted RecB family nuclease